MATTCTPHGLSPRRRFPATAGRLVLLALLALMALSGCSTTRTVEGEVQSHSRLSALPTPATYRIDRLPSQQVPTFDAIEALAEQALERVGLRKAGSEPAGVRVQITVEAGTTPRIDPYAPHAPWSGLGSRWGLSGWISVGRGGPVGPRIWHEPTPLLRRAVTLVLRDGATQAVVYETSAVHEDIWVSDPAVYGVLFDAALSGFPNPPTGQRRVDLPLPASSTPAATRP